MNAVLHQINAQPGMVGSLVCSLEGVLLAEALPNELASQAFNAALLILEQGVAAIEESVGAVRTLDLRYSDNRIVCKVFTGGILVLVCTRTVNLQLVNITLNVAMKRLVKLIANTPPPAPQPVEAVAEPPQRSAKPQMPYIMPFGNVAADTPHVESKKVEPASTRPKPVAPYVMPFGNLAAEAPHAERKKKKSGGWTLADLDG